MQKAIFWVLFDFYGHSEEIAALTLWNFYAARVKIFLEKF